jgi:hypothetical protein
LPALVTVNTLVMNVAVTALLAFIVI